MVQDKILRIRVDHYGLAIGVISTLMSLSFIGGYIYAVANLGDISSELEARKTSADEDLVIKKKIVAVCVVGMIINASLFIASIVLMIGSFKVNHRMVLPWIVINIIGFIFFLTIMGCLANTARDKLKEFKSIGAFFGYSATIVFMIFGTVMGILLYRYLGYQRAYT